jgi:hypothetical protein
MKKGTIEEEALLCFQDVQVGGFFNDGDFLGQLTFTRQINLSFSISISDGEIKALCKKQLATFLRLSCILAYRSKWKFATPSWTGSDSVPPMPIKILAGPCGCVINESYSPFSSPSGSQTSQ